jgi:hypothetical protein
MTKIVSKSSTRSDSHAARCKPKGNSIEGWTDESDPVNLLASKTLSRSAASTSLNANMSAGWPGRSLLVCWRAGFARAS